MREFSTSLLFHSFDNLKSEDEFYDLSLNNFKQLLIKLSEKFNASRVTLTFDDGYSSIIPAIEWAHKLGFKTKAYIITSKVNKKGYLSEKDITDLYKKGTIIGSHSHSHLDLTKLDKRKLIFELKYSKNFLSEIIDSEVVELSIPFGSYSKQVLDSCFLFYKFVAISKPLLFNKKNLIGRLSIHKANFKRITFIKSVLQGKLNLIYRFKLLLLYFLKKLLNQNQYIKLKSIFKYK